MLTLHDENELLTEHRVPQTVSGLLAPHDRCASMGYAARVDREITSVKLQLLEPNYGNRYPDPIN